MLAPQRCCQVAAMAFGISLLQLKELYQIYGTHDKEAFHKRLGEYGGVAGVAQKLNTSPDSGIKAGSVEARIEEFGENDMPTKPPPTYLELAWEALQDATLIMLIVAAIISLVLGMVFEEDKSTAWCVAATCSTLAHRRRHRHPPHMPAACGLPLHS